MLGPRFSLMHRYRSSPLEKESQALSPYAIVTLLLVPPRGIRSGSDKGITVRVTMSFLSTPPSAESASSVRVVRPTSVVRVRASPLQSEGFSVDTIPSPCHSRSRADAR
jgi:hypothetical protein